MGHLQSIPRGCRIFSFDSPDRVLALLSPENLRIDLKPRGIGGGSKHTFETLRSCNSYFVCVNGTSAYEATTMIIRKGTPKRRGLFRSVLLRRVAVSGFESKTAMTKVDEQEVQITPANSITLSAFLVCHHHHLSPLPFIRPTASNPRNGQSGRALETDRWPTTGIEQRGQESCTCLPPKAVPVRGFSYFAHFQHRP